MLTYGRAVAKFKKRKMKYDAANNEASEKKGIKKICERSLVEIIGPLT